MWAPFGGSPFGGSPFGGSPFGGSPFGGVLLLGVFSFWGCSPFWGSPFGVSLGCVSFFSLPPEIKFTLWGVTIPGGCNPSYL